MVPWEEVQVPGTKSVASSEMALATWTVATTISGGYNWAAIWAKTMARPEAAARKEQRPHIPCYALVTRRSMGGSREIGVLGGHQREDQLRFALTQSGGDDEGEQNGWEGELKVDDAHDERFDPATQIGGGYAKRRPQCQRDGAGDETDFE